MYVGEQILFAHATYGLTRYRQNVQLDNNFFNADAGLNWKFGRFCKGNGVASISQNQVPFQEQAHFGGVQTVTAQSVSETARCDLTGYMSGIIEGAYRTSAISGETPSSARQSLIWRRTLPQTPALVITIRKIKYEAVWSIDFQVDTVRTQATFTDRAFGNRSPATTTVTGLASETELNLYEVVYHRDIGPKLKFDGNLGFNQITTVTPNSASANITGWSYSATLLYKITPKMTLQLNSARGVGPPLAVLSNFQLTQVNAISLDYRFSSKLTFNGALGFSNTLNATSTFSNSSFGSTSSTGINPVAGNFQTRTVQIGARYRISPFANAFASYSYLDSKNAQLGQTSLQNVYLVGLTWQH